MTRVFMSTRLVLGAFSGFAAVLNGEVALVQSGLAKLVVSFHCLPMRSRNSRSLASSHRLGSVRLMFELPSCAYLAILRAPSLPNCDS
jgi:hypothetical protein